MKAKSNKPATQPLATANRFERCHSTPARTLGSSPTPVASRQRHRVVELLGSLHQNHLQWAELVIRMREETQLTYRDIAQLAEAPIARIRRACTDAKHHRAQLLAPTTTN